MVAIVAAICESISAGVFVVCPFLLSGLTACPIRTQLDHAAARRCKLCRSVTPAYPPFEKQRVPTFQLLAGVQDNPDASRLRGAARAQKAAFRTPRTRQRRRACV